MHLTTEWMPAVGILRRLHWTHGQGEEESWTCCGPYLGVELEDALAIAEAIEI